MATSVFGPMDYSSSSSGGGSIITPKSKYFSSIGPYGELQFAGSSMTPQQVYDWIMSHSREDLINAIKTYNIDPYHVVYVYNLASPTDVSLEDASAFLQMPVTDPSERPSDLSALYGLIDYTLAQQQQMYQQQLKAVQDAIASYARQQQRWSDPQTLRQYLDALQQAVAQSQEKARATGMASIASTYQQQIPQVLANLASRGIINSSVGGQALAGLGGDVIRSAAALESALAGQQAPYMGAMTQMFGAQQQAASAVPALTLSLLGQTPTFDIGTLGTLIGLFDLIGNTFT